LKRINLDNFLQGLSAKDLNGYDIIICVGR